MRGEGVFSGLRTMSGVQVLLHSARIARGNSGGPLVDRCGRVLGINSALTRGDDGDASFGFAIADTELMAFLRENKQPFASTGGACTSIEERLDRDRDADARAAEGLAQQQRDAAIKAAQDRAAALEQAREDAERTRENVMGLAGAVAGRWARSGVGAGGLFESRGQRRDAIWAASAGGALIWSPPSSPSCCGPRGSRPSPNPPPPRRPRPPSRARSARRSAHSIPTAAA